MKFFISQVWSLDVGYQQDHAPLTLWRDPFPDGAYFLVMAGNPGALNSVAASL